MKIFFFRIPEKRTIDFVRLCLSLDINIAISWQDDSGFNTSICGYVQLTKSSAIPEAMQEEKLNEKFGKFIKTEL